MGERLLSWMSATYFTASDWRIFCDTSTDSSSRDWRPIGEHHEDTQVFTYSIFPCYLLGFGFHNSLADTLCPVPVLSAQNGAYLVSVVALLSLCMWALTKKLIAVTDFRCVWVLKKAAVVFSSAVEGEPRSGRKKILDGPLRISLTRTFSLHITHHMSDVSGAYRLTKYRPACCYIGRP